jgi:hypothetical protein
MVAAAGLAERARAWPNVVVRLRGAPLERGPISYFNTACASCHGDYGSFYGERFAADLEDAELRRIVREMVEGPAQSRLDARDLTSLTAYHRSLADRSPFLAWTGTDGGDLVGEVSPGSAVTVVFEGTSVTATVEGHTWRAPRLDGQGTWKEIRAERDERTTVLRRGWAFSHPPPSEADAPR